MLTGGVMACGGPWLLSAAVVTKCWAAGAVEESVLANLCVDAPKFCTATGSVFTGGVMARGPWLSHVGWAGAGAAESAFNLCADAAKLGPDD